jgi:hypothetical protein
MTKRKDAISPRMKWFCCEIDAFREDPRMLRFTRLERTYWLGMCAESFHSGGSIYSDPDVVSDSIGMSRPEAVKILSKLLSAGLLVSDGVADACCCHSPRMVAEHLAALASYDASVKKGKKGGEAKRDNLLRGVAGIP